jgi:cell fate (sporulation/competence/biofilm development) regulator YlbF (YheA/YmcA/DUF963 family)
VNVYDKAHELAKALKLSPEVVDFKNATEKLKTNEVNKKIVGDIKRLQFQMYTMQMQGKELPKDQVDAFNNLMNIVNMNLEIRQFIEAEMKFQQMFQEMMKIIEEAVGIGPSMEIGQK